LPQNNENALIWRPFQKKKSRLSLNIKNSRTNLFQSLKTRHLAAHSQEEEEEQNEEVINILMTPFKQLLDAWPFHLQDIDELGRTRYRLTRLEKGHLKSLGLQNLFNTTWPKRDPCHSRPCRWKRI
jgi:hypothetical protein